MSNRILAHPIIDDFHKGQTVRFFYNGVEIEGCDGEPIAMALRANGVSKFRETARFSKPRGVFCAIGRCTDCVMVVDGIPNTRTCVTPLREGMHVETQHGTGTMKEVTT